jgi:hypothetical protein
MAQSVTTTSNVRRLKWNQRHLGFDTAGWDSDMVMALLLVAAKGRHRRQPPG